LKEFDVTITAIETCYAGHRFRSRLEARWAVFFDHLGIKWRYETEGYNLPDGSRYLPDFLIHPNTPREFWFEVKGTHPTADELEKAQGLATGTKSLVFVYFGEIEQPGLGLSSWNGRDFLDYCEHDVAVKWLWDNETGWYTYPSGPHSWEIGVTPTAYRVDPATERFPAREPKSNHIWWTDCSRCGEVILKLQGQEGPCPFADWPEGDLYPSFRHETARLAAAYKAARSARFEHGECG
jgi:hypothetical protein